jgi:hypothetical protein
MPNLTVGPLSEHDLDALREFADREELSVEAALLALVQRALHSPQTDRPDQNHTKQVLDRIAQRLREEAPAPLSMQDILAAKYSCPLCGRTCPDCAAV